MTPPQPFAPPPTANPSPPALSVSLAAPPVMSFATPSILAHAQRRTYRRKLYVVPVLLLAAGVGGGYLYLTRPGTIEVVVEPKEATLEVDGVMMTVGPPFLVEKPPGVHRLKVSRDGYIPRELNVEISAGQLGHVTMALEPSAHTGFFLTSQPPGGLIWLDGKPLMAGQNGQQAVTNFRASGIEPGGHVVEIRGNPLFQVWRQEMVQAAGRTVLLHADLVPVPGAQKSVPASAKTARASASGPAVLAAPAPRVPSATSTVQRKSKDKQPARAKSTGENAAKPESAGSDDVFENMKIAPAHEKTKPPAADEDIFEK